MSQVYEWVTERIIKKLETGVVPWRIPWTSSSRPVNWQTQKPYRGINAMLLDAGEYATFQQIRAAGGKVKPGSKGQMVVFWKLREIEKANEATGEKDIEIIPILRYYTVFEINTQCEGLKSRRKDGQPQEHNPIEEAEKIVKDYRSCPPIAFAPGRAFYRPSTDSISVPALTDYHNPEEFYSTLFHEMTHSTGHPSRLKRPGVTQVVAFGDDTYSREELIAEIGAAMLCGVAEIATVTLDNSAAYIASWLKRLKEDKRLIVTAAAAAQKAADFILGFSGEVEEQ